MSPPKSTRNDRRWYKNLLALHHHIKSHGGAWPNSKTNPSLRRWVNNHRTRYKKDPSGPYWKWRHKDAGSLGIDLLRDRRPVAAPSPSEVKHYWGDYLKSVPCSSQEKLDVDWFWSLMERYKGRSGFLKVKGSFSTLMELMMRWLKLGDVAPSECSRLSAVFDIRHTASYILWPHRPEESSPSPDWRFNPIGNEDGVGFFRHDNNLMEGGTVHFNADKFPDQHIWDSAIDDLPWFVKLMGRRQIDITVDALVHEIQHMWEVDHYPVSLMGTNHSGGVKRITSTRQKGPRRLNLFDSVSGPRYSKKWKCHVEDGYSYTLSFTYSPFYGGRSLRFFPGIAELKLYLWKKLHDHLTPLSKLCPPNGVQVLYYFSAFDSKINFHKDMNPDMVVDDSTNSQILGTNVTVATLFMGQLVQLCSKPDTRSSVDEFYTHHGSVYVLHPHDDLRYYHGTGFYPHARRQEYQKNKGEYGGLRVAITFRWLGNRMTYLGDDYWLPKRRHCQAVNRAHHVISNKHPKRKDISEMYCHYLEN